MSTLLTRFGLVLLAGVGVFACEVEPAADRAAWLQATLVADRYRDIRRNPELVAAQFERMSEDAFTFMRGTNGQFRRDLVAPVGIDTRTDFASMDASHVQLIGDAHIENIGTFLTPSGEIVLEFNDFDAAVYGPYHLDVWRLGQSWVAFGASTTFSKLDDADWLDIAVASAMGYAEEVALLAEGREGPDLRAGVVLADLVKEAEEDGLDLAELSDVTEVSEAGVRSFVFPGVDDEGNVIDSDLLPLLPQEQRFVEDELAAWQKILPGEGQGLGALHATARRFGSGVTSVAVYRYYLLFEGPTPAPEDDVLIEWKETRDPVVLGTNMAFGARLFSSNAERVTVMQRRAHAEAATDRFAGWAGEEPWSFRSRRNSGYQQGISRDRILRRLRDGRFDKEDLSEAAHATGQLLARSHARPATRTGLAAAPVIRDAIGSDLSAFREEARARIADLGQLVVRDYYLFLRLRELYDATLQVRK